MRATQVFSVQCRSFLQSWGHVIQECKPSLGDGFSDNGYLNAALLLLLAHIIACTRLFYLIHVA